MRAVLETPQVAVSMMDSLYFSVLLRRHQDSPLPCAAYPPSHQNSGKLPFADLPLKKISFYPHIIT
jgi:hypothetical protein